MSGIFNPNSTLLADLSLLLSWTIFIGLLITWFLVRLKRKTDIHHKMMFYLLGIHFILILFMLLSFLTNLETLIDNLDVIPMIHSIVGSCVFIIALYTLLRMAYPRRIPNNLRIANTKLLMQITAISWMLLVISGTFLYISWYF